MFIGARRFLMSKHTNRGMGFKFYQYHLDVLVYQYFFEKRAHSLPFNVLCYALYVIKIRK